MAVSDPRGTGKDLGEFLEELVEAVNRAQSVSGDGRILVSRHHTGWSLSLIKSDPAADVILARITGAVSLGTTGKRFRYSWTQVELDDKDDDNDTTEGLSGDAVQEDNYALNLCEINNTAGASSTQGNGMELVQRVPDNAVVMLRAVPRLIETDISANQGTQAEPGELYVFQYENSDHIDEINTTTIGATSADGGSEPALSDDYEVEVDNDGNSANGTSLLWNEMHRVGYFEASGTIWGYVRPVRFRPNGKMMKIDGETRVEIEVAVDCP